MIFKMKLFTKSLGI